MRHGLILIAWTAQASHWLITTLAHYGFLHSGLSAATTALAGAARAAASTLSHQPLLPVLFVCGPAFALSSRGERPLNLGDLHTPCRAPSASRTRVIAYY